MKEWLRTGTMIGHYRVVMRIGVSAIGEVYQVRDEINFRDCALKLLAGTLGWDQTSQQRFIAIVKSAPPLNHPNISRILDAGLTETGRPYVVTEIVHGRTLDEIGIGLARKLYDKIQITIQIAEALEIAHQMNVLHLGIKPSNVMLDHRGQIRVLDFAVTLATQIAIMSRGPKAPPHKLTIGVARYLSPEQVRGEKPTPQSDIFSLGSLAYELFSSQLPFPGRSVEEVTKGILHNAPEELTLENHEVPANVNPVLMKALAKNPAERYRSAGEFAKALGQLAEEEKASELVKAKGKSKRDYEEDGQFKVNNLLELLRDLLKKWKKKIIAALIFKATALAIFLTWQHFRADNNFKLPEEPLAFAKITTSGKVLDAVLSPNGQNLVYLVEENGRHDLLLKPLLESRDTLLFSTKEFELNKLTFGWDNEFVYFVKSDPAPSVLYRVSIRGGGNQKLLEGIVSPVSVSPSNRQLAFVRQTGAESQLVITTLGTKTERIVATRRSPASLAASGPAWSHDGKTIACAVKNPAHDLTLELVAFEVETGAEKQIAAGDWTEIGRLAWLAGDEALLVNGRALPYQQWQIWSANRASGQLKAITTGINDYRGLSLIFDTRRAVSVNHIRDAGLWLGTNDQANQLISGQDEGMSGLAWLGKDQLVYTSRANRHEEIWRAPAGVGQAQLLKTLQPQEVTASFTPSASADGSKLIFAAVKQGQTDLWQGEFGTNALKQLTNGKLNLYPQLSADGGMLLYSALTGGKATLVKLDPATGAASVLLDQHAWGGVISPDGSQIAFNHYDETSGGWKVGLMPVTGGPVTGNFTLPGDEPRILRWMPDGTGLAYIVTKRGISNLWRQPLDGSAPAPLTNFTKYRLYNFAWSPDGTQLAVARGRTISDAVIIGGW
jgi:serine/threonine protein kinase